MLRLITVVALFGLTSASWLGGDAVLVEGAHRDCDVPPEYWCSSEDVAQRCKVQNQCDRWSTRFEKKGNPVKVSIYFESLCPDCQHFFLTQVAHAAKVLPSSILQFDFIPFGNSKMSQKGDSSYDFTCQHGPDECYANIFETCSTYVLKNVDQQLEYILCVENRTSHGEGIKPVLSECAKLDIPTSKYDTWLHCGKGHVGNSLEGSMGKRTGQLSPRHTFVPWVTFNGAGSEAISYAAIDDLVKTVCKFYSGPGKCPPSADGDQITV